MKITTNKTSSSVQFSFVRPILFLISAVLSFNTVEAQNVFVSDAASVYISKSAYMYIANNGNLTVSNGGHFLLDSDSNQFSNLYVDGQATGIVEYDRFTASTATRDLVSPPVYGQTFNTFAIDNTGVIAASTLSSGNLLYGPLNEDLSGYIEYASTDVTPLVPAKGYRAGTISGDKLKYTGTVNTTDLVVAITPYTSNGTQHRGINLIGNPFTTHLDVTSVLASLAVNSGINPNYAAIYGWSGTGTSDGNTWKVINSLTQNEVITPGQAFILVGSSTGGSFTFSKSMQTIAEDRDDFIASRMNAQYKFKLNIHATNNHKSTEVYFLNNTTRGLDVTWDAGNIDSSNFKIGTHLVEESQGNSMAIQCLNISDLTDPDYLIPVDLKIPASHDYTFTLSNSSLPEHVDIYLLDMQESTYQIISSDGYSFTTDQPIDGIGRFYLSTSAQALSFSDVESQKALIVRSILDTDLLEVKGSLLEKSQLNLFDLYGRMILNTTLPPLNNQSRSLDISGLQAGVYIVKIKNSNQEFTQKIIIN